MEFSTQQISPKRWGIYSGDRLLATVGCKATCETFMANFVSGRRDAPLNHANALLYQVPQLRRETVTQGAANADKLVGQRLEAALSEQNIAVQELAAAVLKASGYQPPAHKKRARKTNPKTANPKTAKKDKVPSA
jgi:hypothetical protein